MSSKSQKGKNKGKENSSSSQHREPDGADYLPSSHHHAGAGASVKGPPTFGNNPIPFPSGPVRVARDGEGNSLYAMPGTSLGLLTRLKNTTKILDFAGWREFAAEFVNQPVFKVAIVGKVTVVVNDVRLLADTLVTTENYTFLYKGDSQKKFLGPIMNDGLIISDGETWHNHRRAVEPSFHVEFLATQHEKIMTAADNLFKLWDAFLEKNPSPPWNEVPMYQHIQKFMADTMGSVLLSEDFNLLTGGSKIGNAFWTTDILAGGRKAYTLLPILEYVNWFNPTDMSFRKNNAAFKQYVLEVCERRLATIQGSGEQRPRDILDMNARSRALSAQDLADETLGYLYSAVDTTGDLITWALYNLVRHKDVLRKVYLELREHNLCDSLNAAPLTWEAVERLQYLQQVLYESSRLYPIAPLLVRQATQDIIINGYRVPAGTGIFIPTFVLQTDARYWSNPDKFDPDRFHPDNYPNITPYAYFAFGGIDRGCVARHLAQHIAKTVIVRILQSYDLRIAPGYEIVPKLDATMNPSDEAWMRIRQRTKAIREKLPSDNDPIDRGEHLRNMRENFEYTMLPEPDVKERLGDAAVPPYIRNYLSALLIKDYNNVAASAHWNYDFIELIRLLGNVVWAKYIYKPQAHIIRFFKSVLYSVRKTVLREGEDLRKWIEVNYGHNLNNHLIQVERIHFWCWDDVQFAYTHVAGTNPTVIKYIADVNSIEDPQVRELAAAAQEHYRRLAQNAAAAVGAGNIFITDYSKLELVIKKQLLIPKRFLGAPKCYFVVDDRKKLQPLAIRFTDDGPVFTPQIDFLVNEQPYPSSDHRLWNYAKIHAQSADNHYHQFINHLAWTHLVCEPFAIATARNFYPNHPIFMLLQPHLAKNIQIDVAARDILIAPGGLIDRSLTAGRLGGYALVSQAFVEFTFDHLSLPISLSRRQVDDPQVLPCYPYREDGMRLWNAINQFVAHIVRVYYQNDAAVAGDVELDNWANELGEQFRKARKGSPLEGWPHHLNTIDLLVEVLTRLIFTTTAQHSIMNYGLVANYSFVPNSPTLLHMPPPDESTSAESITKDFLKRALPTYDECLNQIGTAHVLADPALPSQTLGGANLSRVYQLDHPLARLAIKRFEQQLDTIANQVDKNMRDQLTNYSVAYEWLHPNKVALNVRI